MNQSRREEVSLNPSLPSLNALRAFEATARHASMTRAARELHVTHGAVSRQIKSLELSLGVTLLARTSRSLELTIEGSRLAEGLGAAFGLIHATINHVKPGPLILSCSSSVAMCWLIPRMPAFYRDNPGIEIKLDMNHDRIDFSRNNVGVAIRNSTVEPPRHALIRDLGVEWIGPVCAPDFAAMHGIARPADLEQASLLATETRIRAWADWCDASGQPALDLRPQHSFEHFYLMIQAAASGLGVAMIPHMLAIDDLQSRRLVAPFGFVPGPRRLFLWIAPHLGERRDIRTLEAWLTREMLDHVPA